MFPILDMHMLLQNDESFAGWEKQLCVLAVVVHARLVSYFSFEFSPSTRSPNAIVKTVMQRDIARCIADRVGGTALDDSRAANGIRLMH